MEDNKSSANKTVRSANPAPPVPGVKAARIRLGFVVPNRAVIAPRDAPRPPKPAGATTAQPTTAAPVNGNHRRATAKQTSPETTRARAPRKLRLQLPPILLETDRQLAPPANLPPRRDVRRPAPPAIGAEDGESLGELPEAYGTRRLFLTARDPQWLYAHWDLTREQQRTYNQRSADGHLALRVHVGSPAGEVAAETHVHPESRHWFVHVGQAATRYVAELGYRRPDGQWTSLCISEATMTPPEKMSADPSVRYAALPPGVSAPKLRTVTKAPTGGSLPLVEVLPESRAPGWLEAEAAPGFVGDEFTAASEFALAPESDAAAEFEARMRSLELSEAVASGQPWELASLSAAQRPAARDQLGGISSPAGGERPAPAKAFRLSVNAELVIYGATEPDAVVSLGGRPIALRPDGTFSGRIALPDGPHALAVLATSADGTDARWADLEFVRRTRCGGEVRACPADPATLPSASDPPQCAPR